jgi:hypothetical protein
MEGKDGVLTACNDHRALDYHGSVGRLLVDAVYAA